MPSSSNAIFEIDFDVMRLLVQVEDGVVKRLDAVASLCLAGRDEADAFSLLYAWEEACDSTRDAVARQDAGI